MADAKSLAVLLKLEANAFQRGLAGAAKDLQNFSRKTEGLRTSFLIAGGAITAFAGLSIRQFANTSEELSNMAAKTGFSVQSLAELKYAAELSEASLGTIQVAFRTLSMALNEAKIGTASYARAFQQLALDIAEFEGKKPEEIFLRVAGAVADEKDAMVRAALAQDVFGRGGMELLPMLEGGREGLSKVREEAHRLGLVYSDDMVTAGKAAADQMKMMSGATQGLMIAIGSQLMPVMLKAILALTELVTGFTEFAKANPALVQSIAAIGIVLVSLAAALKMVAMWKAVALAMSGPAGWATLGVAAAVAGGSILAMNKIAEMPSPTFPSGAGQSVAIRGTHAPTINVTVQGNVVSEDGLAKSIAPAISREIAMQGQRGGGIGPWSFRD